MESTETNIVKKNPSIIEKFGNLSLDIGNKLGKVATEFFVGKQPTEEEKELNKIRKERKLKLKLIQEDAQYQKDLEAAKRGEYVPQFPITSGTKKKEENIFANLGKHNPLEGFEKQKSLGTDTFGIEKFGSGNSSKQPDFGLEGFAGSVNPMGERKRRN